jgi:hypothetical protein
VTWLYSLAQPFIWHPARAAAVAAASIALAYVLPRPARRPLLVVALAWGAFSLLELLAWRERADIRVDLLFTWPALCLLTALSLMVCVKRLRARVAARAIDTQPHGDA